MGKLVDVSVVIVNWNTREMLLDCIESLYKETLKVSMEIIVVDNDSHDGSPDAVRKKYPEVKVIVNPGNFGFARANNIGFDAATGRYVCLVNSDIIALENVLDRMTAYMDDHPRIGALGPKTINEHNMLRQNVREIPTLRNSACDYWFFGLLSSRIEAFRGRTMRAASYEYTHKAGVLSGCFLMVRRETLEQVGYLDERFFFYGEDTDWSRRFWDAGWKVVYYADAVSIHLGGASTAAAPLRYLIINEKADMQYWRKHHNRFVQFLYWFMKTTYRLNYGIIWSLIYLLRKSNKEYSRDKMVGHLGCFRWLMTDAFEFMGKKG